MGRLVGRKARKALTTFLAPLLDADLLAQPFLHPFATDASPLGAGNCATPVSRELWTLLYDFSDEEGCSVSLDWDTSSMPPPEVRDSRATVTGLVVDLPWVESFSYRFRYPQHINLPELEALISLIRGLVDRGLGNRCVLCLVDSRVVLVSVCKGRCVNFRLRRLGGLLLANNVARLVLGTLLGKRQRRAVAFLLSKQVARHSPELKPTVALHARSSA